MLIHLKGNLNSRSKISAKGNKRNKVSVYFTHVVYKYTNYHETLDLFIISKAILKKKICDLITVTMEIGPHCVY